MSMEQGAEYLHTHYPLAQSAAEIEAGIETMLRDLYYNEVPAKPGAAALLAALAAKGMPDGGGDLQPARACDRTLCSGWGCCGYFAQIFRHR